jgi:HEAT repeat protein
MSERWEGSTGRVAYTVELGDDGKMEFAASGPAGVQTGVRGDSETIWVEEFPDNDRWQKWVRERLGEEALVEIQNTVASALEDLAARRKETFAGAVDGLHGDDGAARRRAVDRIRSLAERYDGLADHAVRELAEALDSEDEELRRAASEALRSIATRHPGAVDTARETLERALGDDHPNVRLDAARTLVTLAAPEGEAPDRELFGNVVETLIGLLHEHTRWFSQGPVAGLLGELGREHPDAVEPAIEPLVRFVVGELSSGSGTSGIGRSTAVRALVEIGEANLDEIAEYADIFLRQLQSGRPGVRGRSAEALGMLAARDGEFAARAVPALAERLDDTNFVRESALEALRRVREASPDRVEKYLDEEQLELLEDDVEISG